MKICFATNNTHKVKEVAALLPPLFRLVTLSEIGCFEELPEEQDTLEGNSFQKASYVFERYSFACIADDTGLEVDALDGRPGVYSARYAGPQADSTENVRKLMKEMQDKTNRSARFRTVISLIEPSGRSVQFEGVVEGEITLGLSGTAGFGYDPVFRPEGYKKTFAEMTANEKNAISHRGIAVGKLVEYLKSEEKSIFSS